MEALLLCCFLNGLPRDRTFRTRETNHKKIIDEKEEYNYSDLWVYYFLITVVSCNNDRPQHKYLYNEIGINRGTKLLIPLPKSQYTII